MVSKTGVQSGPAIPRKPHDHSSLRIDGWLDNCCLRCGADGYWWDGKRLDPERITRTKRHPSGKLLIWPERMRPLLKAETRLQRKRREKGRIDVEPQG